jgi:hemoglobin/transferrin/lactoferrin receptor protein
LLLISDLSGATATPVVTALSSAVEPTVAPNITNLGSLGLVGVGFQVSTSDVLGLGATVGSTADESAVTTGVAVAPLKSEISNNYDVSLRLRRGRVEWEATGFVIDYANAIVRQTLILPPGAVGRALGSQRIERQNANGAVFVPLSTAPVLVQANFGGTRLRGFEFDTDIRLSKAWTLGGNYTYVRAEDRMTGAPPNLGGGGLPPQTGFLRLRYQPPSSRYWVEAYSTLAGRQDRLSSLDLADRRTGATRSRTNIQNFFRRGACVYGAARRAARSSRPARRSRRCRTACSAARSPHRSSRRFPATASSTCAAACASTRVSPSRLTSRTSPTRATARPAGA